MMKLAAVHLGTERPDELGKFYRHVLGIEPEWANDDVIGFMVGDCRLEVMRHDKVSGMNANPERTFFDLMVDDVAGEFKRIVALGASVVQEPYDFAEETMKMSIATLADPDGNYFQLVSITML